MNCLERERFYTLEHYEYGEAFTGSFRSKCYRLAIEPLENVHFVPPDKRGERSLRAWVWDGPFAFAETEDEKKECKDFPYTEEGLVAAVEWLDSMCEGAEPLKLL